MTTDSKNNIESKEEEENIVQSPSLINDNEEEAEEVVNFKKSNKKKNIKNEKYSLQQEKLLFKRASDCFARQTFYGLAVRYWTLCYFGLSISSLVMTAVAVIVLGTQSSSSNNNNLELGMRILLAVATLLQGVQSLTSPQREAERCQQACNAFGGIVSQIENEITLNNKERDNGRYFIRDIWQQINIIKVNAPNIPWIISRQKINALGEVEFQHLSTSERSITVDTKSENFLLQWKSKLQTKKREDEDIEK